MTTPSAAKKRITQQSFDETVRENIEEFELCREEAIKDAVKQFTTQGKASCSPYSPFLYTNIVCSPQLIITQGVDLTNICISFDECHDHWLEEVASQVDALASLIEDGQKEELPQSLDREAVLSGLRGIHAYATDPKPDRALNAKKIFASKQTINLVAKLWASQEKDIVMLAMETAQVQ